jgi:HD-GYP domain-containing protein (c-di-GMP phosphodiesterase class II)
MRISKKDSFWLGMQYLGTPNFIKQNNKDEFFIVDDQSCEDLMVLLSCLVDYKSRLTASHSSCVAACSEKIARYVGFSENDAKLMRYAGYIHDIGKLAIPTEILEKPGPLSKEEFDLIRTHAYHTDRVLSKVSGFETIRVWASHHHEKLNGKGYPFGLKVEEISLGSRIMAVADIFTALRERRSYRDSITKKITINILMDKSASYEIDKELVKIVKNNFDELDIVRELAYENRVKEYEKFTEKIEKIKNIKMKVIS